MTTSRSKKDNRMLEQLNPQPQDKILQLIAMYREDPRADKIDLGVGVYKDATGLTPVMRAVKAAEKQLWETETTKTYTGLAGEPAYNAAMIEMILGAGFAERAASVATPGGTGAIRQALELIKLASPKAKVWLSNPTWPNHPSIIKYLGMQMAEYRYFDAETRGIDFEGLMQDLANVTAGDAVLLHGCCHNPTGANLNADQWAQVAALLLAKGAIPFVDLAYQGFGDGLEEDAAATRMIAATFPEVLIAASCSKNFGIYRERTGILIALGEASRKAVTQGNLNFLNRQNYSFPPDHGARLVTMILQDDALRADWKAELEEVRQNMLGLRQSLADALRLATNSDRFDFVASHRGMFSRLGLTEAQVNLLREEHGIYMVGDSRINIAGLNAKTVPILAAAIAKVAR
jgi:aspartate/tyrosine/aromatic aminotransferase